MSNQSSKTCAELDRENAHFSVSEAMIAAIEEVSSDLIDFWNLYLKNVSNDY